MGEQNEQTNYREENFRTELNNYGEYIRAVALATKEENRCEAKFELDQLVEEILNMPLLIGYGCYKDSSHVDLNSLFDEDTHSKQLRFILGEIQISPVPEKILELKRRKIKISPMIQEFLELQRKRFPGSATEFLGGVCEQVRAFPELYLKRHEHKQNTEYQTFAKYVVRFSSTERKSLSYIGLAGKLLQEVLCLQAEFPQKNIILGQRPLKERLQLIYCSNFKVDVLGGGFLDVNHDKKKVYVYGQSIELGGKFWDWTIGVEVPRTIERARDIIKAHFERQHIDYISTIRTPPQCY